MVSKSTPQLFIGSTIVLASLLLVNCTPDTSAPSLPNVTVEPIPTRVAINNDNLLNSILDEVLVPTVPPFTDYDCLSCHANEAQLTELAVEEEDVAESLSSGPG